MKLESNATVYRQIIATLACDKCCIKFFKLLDTFMAGPLLNTYSLKRRFAVLFLAVFSITVMTGTLAHAYIGESFGANGKDHQSVHSINLHDYEHDHRHDHEQVESISQSHSHDHNPGDHSHEVPGFVMPIVNTQNSLPNTKYHVFAVQQNGRASFNIDRPPRR